MSAGVNTTEVILCVDRFGMAAATVMVSVIKFALKSVLRCLQVSLAQPQSRAGAAGACF